MKKSILLFLLSSLTNILNAKIAVVIVVDQLPYRTIEKLYPFFSGGLKNLIEEGLVYKSAYHPHAMPATSVGHTALSTGVFAKKHGIIGNAWLDETGKHINCYDDPSHKVFTSQKKTYDHGGKSAKNNMVEGITDKFVKESPLNKTISLSLKARAAIGMANKLGKAIWLDNEKGQFTSSIAYFETLPNWLMDFNKNNSLMKKTEFTWRPLYSENNQAYQSPFANDYQFSRQASILNKEIKRNNNKPKFMKELIPTPFFNNVLFELAETWLEKQKEDFKFQNILLWISLSSMDKIGSTWGPESKEAIDMVLQIDQQLKRFMEYVENLFPDEEILFIFTSDHGVASIPELAKKMGHPEARRINEKELIKKLNQKLAKKFGLNDLIIGIELPGLYLDKKQTSQLSREAYKKIIELLRNTLLEKPGIKNVWTYTELKNKQLDPIKDKIEYHYQSQLYPNRSGDMIIQVEPYTLVTSKDGTGHRSPYDYDTHVPLMLREKNL